MIKFAYWELQPLQQKTLSDFKYQKVKSIKWAPANKSFYS